VRLFNFGKKIASESVNEHIDKQLKFINAVGQFPISVGNNPEQLPPWDNSVVMAAVKWAGRVFPEAPFTVEEFNKDHYSIVQNHPLAQMVKKPNEFYGGNLLFSGTLLSLLVDGNAYWLKLRNDNGVVKELWYAPHTAIQPIVFPGSVEVEYYIYRAGGKVFNIAPEDIVHFRDGLDPYQPWLGLSPIKSVIREILTDNEIAQYSHVILKNSGVPGVVITPKDANATFEETEADAIAMKFKKRFSGEGRGAPLILDSQVDVKELGFSPKDIAVDVMRSLPESRICAVLGIHPAVLGLQVGLEHSTFHNFSEARAAAYESLVIPLQQLICGEIDSQLLDEIGDSETQRSKFDLSQVRILQEDESAKVDRSVNLYQGGILKRSEARAVNGLDYTDADEIYITDIQPNNSFPVAKSLLKKQMRERAQERAKAYKQYFEGKDDYLGKEDDDDLERKEA